MRCDLAPMLHLRHAASQQRATIRPASYASPISLEHDEPMSLIRRRPRVAAVFAALAAIALIATLILVNRPSDSGPELLGAGGSLPVTAAESANGPVDKGNGHWVGADQHHDKS